MKKNLKGLLAVATVMCLAVPQKAYANMAAPTLSDIGSSVTFEKSEEIAVLSEVLDIIVTGTDANIVATYKMKNTTNENISTPSMFLSPNIQNSGVSVLVNHKAVDWTSDSYALNYSTEVAANDWQYTVLVDEETASQNEYETVDAITFQMDFAPWEEYDVVVSYRYRLGGYPDSDFDAKRGEITYYLSPAAMWKEFSSLTINLYLDENMPILKSSNLAFEKMDTRTYQYTSNTLPKENLKIMIDEDWWQNIWSTLRNPYVMMVAKIILPIILIPLMLLLLIVRRIRKRRKTS